MYIYIYYCKTTIIDRIAFSSQPTRLNFHKQERDKGERGHVNNTVAHGMCYTSVLLHTQSLEDNTCGAFPRMTRSSNKQIRSSVIATRQCVCHARPVTAGKRELNVQKFEVQRKAKRMTPTQNMWSFSFFFSYICRKHRGRKTYIVGCSMVLRY